VTGTLGRMKRLTKILGIIGGLAAIVWAIRDRFISVAISREPEPPSFRAPETSSDGPVDTIDGIGPTFAKRLGAAGIGTVSRLAGASPDSVAEAAGVSAARARAWIEQAATRSD
jgi:predicted flap endonuclease-1-like 5' DNA nuclease